MNPKGPSNAALMALTVIVLMLALAGSGCRSQRATARGAAPAVVSPAASSIIEEARRWLGTPYRYGGKERRRGTDCSGMVMEVYRTTTGVALPRNSAHQQEFCRKIKRSELSAGDLVFFSSKRGGGRVSHVGIYVGDGRFIHASSSRGVMESGLDEQYFATHFHSAGRVPGIPAGTTPVQPVAEPVVEPTILPEVAPLPLPDTIASPEIIPEPIVEPVEVPIVERVEAPAAAPDTTAIADSIRSVIINAFGQ